MLICYFAVALFCIPRFTASREHYISINMVSFMMKSHLLSIKMDPQPSLFLSGILKGVSVETPETPCRPATANGLVNYSYSCNRTFKPEIKFDTTTCVAFHYILFIPCFYTE